MSTQSKSFRKNNLLKVVILGDGGVGKSCLMNRFVTNNYDTHSFQTVGVEFSNKEMEWSGESYTLQLWDTAGQERFKSLRTPFYRGTDICMLAYAVNDRSSYNNLTMWRNEFLSYSGVKDTQGFPFLVVGSKVDLASGREVSEDEVMSWCESNGHMPYIETSAKDAINVERAFALAVECWNKLEETMKKSPNYAENTINLRNKPNTKYKSKSGCCS